MSGYGYNDDPGSFGSYHAGAPPSGGGGAARDSSNEFTRITQLVTKNIQSITQNVAQIQRMVGQIGTAQDSTDLRDRLHQIQHYTQQQAKDTTRDLKKLSQLPAAGNQSEQRQRKMQKERLMSDFTASLNNFQAAQRSAAEREKASVARARAASGMMSEEMHFPSPPKSNRGGDPFLDERRSDDLLVNTAESPVGNQSSQIQMEQDLDLTLITERENAIKQLESDIMDVNQIFKDLGMLVHEQGEVIDSIEANVETAAVQVESGRDQLKKASEYQSKARRKKLICGVLLVVALIIIILIIYFTTKGDS